MVRGERHYQGLNAVKRLYPSYFAGSGSAGRGCWAASERRGDPMIRPGALPRTPLPSQGALTRHIQHRATQMHVAASCFLVDLESSRISVNRVLVSVAYELHDSPGKTRSSRRSVDLDARTVEVLRTWRDERRLEAGRPIGEEDRVVAHRDGEPSLGFEQGDGVPVGVLEPCRAPDALRGYDVVDGLERLSVVLLELDAVGDEFCHVLIDVGRPEADLGVVRLVAARAFIDE